MEDIKLETVLEFVFLINRWVIYFDHNYVFDFVNAQLPSRRDVYVMRVMGWMSWI